MSLRHSYTLLAPLYDLAVRRATAAARRRSLARLGPAAGRRILLPGIGSGLDIPYLPPGDEYVGLDLTPAMLRRARRRGGPVMLVQGDAQALPFPAASFDVVVLHLILAVVPRPERVLAEGARVLRRSGRLLILDKFLRPGQAAPLRRAFSPVLGRLATRTDVVFEPLLARQPELELTDDRAALLGGWFRMIELRRRG